MIIHALRTYAVNILLFAITSLYFQQTKKGRKKNRKIYDDSENDDDEEEKLNDRNSNKKTNTMIYQPVSVKKREESRESRDRFLQLQDDEIEDDDEDIFEL